MIRIRPTPDGYLLLADGRRGVLVNDLTVICPPTPMLVWSGQQDPQCWHPIPIIEEASDER